MQVSYLESSISIETTQAYDPIRSNMAFSEGRPTGEGSNKSSNPSLIACRGFVSQFFFTLGGNCAHRVKW